MRAIVIDDRLDDLWIMAEAGEPFHIAASRIGLRPDSLKRWLRGLDRDLWDKLEANSYSMDLNLQGGELSPQARAQRNKRKK